LNYVGLSGQLFEATICFLLFDFAQAMLPRAKSERLQFVVFDRQ
jgi:hypothetical protein